MINVNDRIRHGKKVADFYKNASVSRFVCIEHSDSNYLMHHGVKGMKWGVRKQEDNAGRRRKSSKHNYKKSNIKSKTGSGIFVRKKQAKEVFPEYVDEKTVRNMNPSKNNLNCAFTSTGYVVSKITGKNVTANEFRSGMLGNDLTGHNETSPDFFQKVLDNTTRTSFNEDAKYFRDLPSMADATNEIKDNTYGIMFVQHPLGFGHYVNYEKRNGMTTIIDCQGTSITGKQVDTPEAWTKKGVRALEYWDCTNATISSKGRQQYLNKAIKMF